MRCRWFGRGGARSSGSSVATASLGYAGGGGINTTEETCGWTLGPPGSWNTFVLEVNRGLPPGSVVRFDPRTWGGGCRTDNHSREGVNIGTRSSSVSPVVGPQSVPSRISVVLVEETGVRCAERLASVPEDKDVRLLAGVACPAGVTVC